jgi:hypothetical protein
MKSYKSDHTVRRTSIAFLVHMYRLCFLFYGVRSRPNWVVYNSSLSLTRGFSLYL